MEEIAKQKVDNLRVYYFLQTLASDIALMGLDTAKKTFDQFVEDKINLLRFFCYFNTDNPNRFVPIPVSHNITHFVTADLIARFIRIVPTCLLKHTDTYLEGPCNLACMMGVMFRSDGLSWYTFDKTSEPMRKALNYVKIKFPRHSLDIGDYDVYQRV
jgi:hypothetical protein